MALKPCRECGKEVSDQAESCPHCGIKNPGSVARSSPPPPAQPPSKKKRSGCLTVFGVCILLLVILTIIGSQSNKSSSPNSPGNTQSQPAQSPSDNVPANTSPAPQSASCSSDWRACKDNADLVNNSNDWAQITSACETAVDQQVRYGEPKWPGLFSGGAFATFYTGTSYLSTGIAVAVEKDVQIENAFGAMVHSTAICRYDLNAQKVLDVSWSPN